MKKHLIFMLAALLFLTSSGFAAKLAPEVAAKYGVKLSELIRDSRNVKFIDYTPNGPNDAGAARYGEDPDAPVTWLTPFSNAFSLPGGKENSLKLLGNLRITGFDGELGALFPDAPDIMTFQELGRFFGGAVRENRWADEVYFSIDGKNYRVYFNFHNYAKNGPGNQIEREHRIVIEPKKKIPGYTDENFEKIVIAAWEAQ